MGALGTTHYAIEDIGVLRSIPNLVTLPPADGLEVVKATWAAAWYEGPVYIRLTGGENRPIVYDGTSLLEWSLQADIPPAEASTPAVYPTVICANKPDKQRRKTCDVLRTSRF